MFYVYWLLCYQQSTRERFIYEYFILSKNKNVFFKNYNGEKSKLLKRFVILENKI